MTKTYHKKTTSASVASGNQTQLLRRCFLIIRNFIFTGFALAGLIVSPSYGRDEALTGVRFGINSFLGNLYHSEIRGPLVKTTAEDRTNYINAMRDCGVTTIRETFMNWAEIEPEQGRGYLFEPYDDIARKASECGIEIVALAYPFPCWATGTKPTPSDQLVTSMGELPQRKFEKDFRKFISTTVKRYCGLYPESIPLKIPIRKWQFSNELDIPRFSIAPDDHAFWLKVFWEEVKKVDPDAKVVHMGVCIIPGLEFLEASLDSPALKGPNYPYFDIITFHCYPGNFGMRNFYTMNASAGNICRILNAHNIKAELWLDETGDRSTDLNLQASQDVKLLVHAASITSVSRVHLHGLWDIGENNHWGILENTPSGQAPVRKPSFAAFKTLLAKIGNNRGVQFLGPGRYLVFLPGRKAVYILWAEPPNTELSGLIKGRVQVTTLQNETKIIDANELKLTSQPVFVERLN